MIIMKFKEKDTEEIVSLFYETVHSVNLKDYSQKQLDVWATKEDKASTINSWQVSLAHNITFVAKINDKIVGFSDLTDEGYLDRLFVHKDFQGQGIASALVDMLESEAKKRNLLVIDTDSSITAKSFFAHKGYNIICSQTVERKGVKLINFKMRKKLTT